VSKRYWDTSCVLPLYISEPRSAELSELAGSQTDSLASSQILAFEFLFAVHARFSRKEIPATFAAKIQRKFLADLAAGRFLLIPLGQEMLADVVLITNRLSELRPPVELRTLDGIHLVTAQQHGARAIVTTDYRMRMAAHALGMDVLPTA
jgi:predicted nucleic acid-binding protein